MPIMTPMANPYNSRINPQSTGVLDAPAISDEQKRRMTQRLFNTEYLEEEGTGLFARVGGYAASSVIDLGDSLWGNNLNPVGDRGDVWNLVGDYGGFYGRELEGFYQRNQAGVEMLSGVAGAIGTGYMAGAMLLPRISNALASSTAISSSRLWQAGARANAATRTRMLEAQGEAAMAGEAFKMLGNPAGRAYLANRAGRVAGIAAFEEAAIVATMNGNEAIWADDMATNLGWAALGVGIGGTLGGISARSEMRKLANSPSMIKLRADSIDPQGLASMRENQPDSDWLAAARGAEAKESANFTSLMLEARQKAPQDAPQEIASRFETARVHAEKQAYDSLQKIASKGVEGVSQSQFRVDGSLGSHLKAAAHNDPTALFGLESLGALRGRNLDEVMEAREAHTKSLLESNLHTNIQQGRRLQEQQPLLLVNDTWMSVNTPETRAFSEFKEGTVEFKQVKGTHEFHFQTQSGRKRKVNESFKVDNFSSMPIDTRLRVVEGMNKLFGSMLKSKETYTVPAKPSWFQLDSAIEYEKRGGEVDWKTDAGFASVEEAKLQSLRLKADEIGDSEIGDIWTRQAFNLPLPNSLERIYDAAGDSLRSALETVRKGGDLESAAALLKEMRAAQGFALRVDNPVLDGNLFNFNRTEKGDWKEPALGFFANEKVAKPFTAESLAEQLAENKASRFIDLTGGTDQSGFIPSLTRQLHSLPELKQSMNIRGLADDQVSGVGSFGTQAVGEILTREFRYRDSQTMLAAQKVREAVNRSTDDYLTHLLQKEMGDVQARLNSVPGQKSKVLLNQFLSNSQGWDLTKEVVDQGDGFYRFALQNTEKNRIRLGAEEIEKGTILVNPRTGAEIVLDDLSMEYVERFQRVSNVILKDKNRLRRALGLNELKRKEWYAPPIKTKGMHIGYTFDELNRPVPGGAIVAKTRGEFERLMAAKRKTLPACHTFRTREQVGDTADLWDRAAMDWIDPGVGPAPARGQTGSLSPDTVNPNAVADSLEWIRTQVESLGTNTMRVLYDSQLGIARARAATERSVKGIKEGQNFSNMAPAIRTVWDEYEATVLGKNLGDLGRSISGQLMHPIESFLNSSIESVWPAVRWMAPSQLGQWLGDAMSQMGLQTPKRVKSFSALAEQLGPYTPYKNAVDYAEQTLKVNRPPEVREISEKMNMLTAALVLRYFELPHAAMNLVGIITTMPSILRSGRAPVTTFFEGAKGQRISAIDSTKIILESIYDLTKKSKHPDWDYMVKNGDATQQVAEFNKQLSLVEDRGTFGRVFFGSGDKKGKTGVRGKFNESGIDGLISVATDSTENWSRSWAHFAGLRLADMHGITGMAARHDFAREIANASIANYAPTNRPELFQSAFGSMFGLFMSWMQSYNQRLFRWMEEGDYASIGRQMGMQSALFGVGSMPGYKIAESMLLKAGVGELEDGREATLTDHIYAKFGPIAGQALLRGGIAETGIVLYGRGDMNYRDVSFDPSQVVASAGVLGNVASAVKQSVQSVITDNGIEDSGIVSEIVARNMSNRVLKGVMTNLLNDGQDIDSSGNIVAENRTFFESSVRLLGLRSTRQQGEIEAFYATRRLQDREAARMDTLRQQTRAALRNPDGMEKIQDIFDQYINHGGRPEHFRTWIRSQLRSAQGTRGMNDMVRGMSNPSNQSKIWRYQMYGGL